MEGPELMLSLSIDIRMLRNKSSLLIARAFPPTLLRIVEDFSDSDKLRVQCPSSQNYQPASTHKISESKRGSQGAKGPPHRVLLLKVVVSPG